MQTQSDQDTMRANEYEMRHRNPLVRDFVVVSRVVLVGYPKLSDGARVTYMVIYSHDWADPDSKQRKGYAYPTIGRLARLRHTTPRTVQRHLNELIGAHLLTRELRRGKPSLLYIEEPSVEETEALHRGSQGRGDKNVTPTKVSPKAEEISQDIKQDKSVNADRSNFMEKRQSHSNGPTSIKTLLQARTLAAVGGEARDWLAQEIVTVTGDEHSLGCYRVIAERCPQELVFEAMSLLKEARHDGSIRQSRGALFVTIVRRLCQERGLADPLPKREGAATTGT